MKFMRGQARRRKGFLVRGADGLCASLIVLGAAGCPGAVEPLNQEGGIVDGNQDRSATSNLGKSSGEPNDTFAEAIVAVFDAHGAARLRGTVEAVGDLDVYRLGALFPGDRIVVDAYASNSPLDVTIALFDDEGRLTVNNDDRDNGGCRIVDAHFDFIARHAGDPYYLVVSHSPQPCNSGFAGGYRVDIVVDSDFDVPQPAAQTLLLDFGGGVVNSPVLGMMTLSSFDAAAIAPMYQGTTQTIKDRIRDVFEQNFERFKVTILTTEDPPLPAGVKYSTIYFGGFDRTAFGLAEDVDLYNVDCCDDAIIFTESFTPSVFTGFPSAQELGTAIGNVGSHEGGHLLGLNHTNDDFDLMDDRSPADAFLWDQEFKEAPLSRDIMPIGTQDGVLLLYEIVGPR